MQEDEEGLRAMERIADEVNNRSNKAAEQLGFTFASAFENAIVEGEKLREVLKGLAQDITRIVVRRTVTEPLANWFSVAIAGMMSGVAARQHGGPVSAGTPYLVGERGPELWVPRESGAIVPHGGFGGVSMSVSIDARGADAGVVARIETAVARMQRTIVPAVVDAVRRGGQAHQVMRG